MRHQILWIAAFAALLALGCGPEDSPGTPARTDATVGRADSVAPEWVTVYDPALAWNGYMLTLHEARVPVLLDMNGRVVHSWPEARLKSRVRLLPDGSILGIGLGRQIVEYDWEGRKTWEFGTPGAIPHHDVLRLANGNTLVLILPDGEPLDTLLEVDRTGRVVWTWREGEHLGVVGLLPRQSSHVHDVAHTNSLQELPDNPWFAAGDTRFRPGNLLLSARNLDTIFIVDRRSGDVVWSFTNGLDRQHEARMNEPGMPAAGMILVFNNRLRSFSGDRQSELLELDPRDGSVVWRYKSPGFYSPTIGLQQALPNGNVLVTSTRGNRVFEVTRAGKLAWEWVPPYQPVRAVRVAPGACPQLAALGVQTLTAVQPPSGYRHVDFDAYRFARQGSRTTAIVDGEKRIVLAQETDCRDLLLPAAARLQIGYGVDRERLRAAGRADRGPEFAVRVRPAGANKDVELLRETVGLEGPSWRRRTIPLDAYALQAVRLCVETAGAKPGRTAHRGRFAYWEQPWIAAAGEAVSAGEGDDGDDDVRGARDLTPEEQEVRRKHLKALGYVN